MCLLLTGQNYHVLKSKLNRGKTLAQELLLHLQCCYTHSKTWSFIWLQLEPSFGRIKQGTMPTSLPFGQLCGCKQSCGTAGFRSRNISLTFAFTNSCCFCRALLSSAMGCVSPREQLDNIALKFFLAVEVPCCVHLVLQPS